MTLSILNKIYVIENIHFVTSIQSVSSQSTPHHTLTHPCNLDNRTKGVKKINKMMCNQYSLYQASGAKNLTPHSTQNFPLF